MIKNNWPIILITTIILALIVGFLIGNNRSRLTSKAVNTTSENKHLDSLFVLTTPVGVLDVLVMEDKILFAPFETNDKDKFNNNLFLTKEKYPLLFQQGVANASFISVKLIESKTSNNISVEVSNNQHDHAVYSSPYRLMVNPVTGEIKEIGPRKYTETN